MNARHERLGVVLLLGCLASPALAQSASSANPSGATQSYGDEYSAGTYGRIRYEENGAAVLRAEAEAREEGLRASVNMPVFPGDSVATGADQRLEVQLAQGALVRIDRDSRLTFLSLPDPYAEHPDHAVLQLAEGNVRLTASVDGGEEFRIDTPAASIYLLGDADLRVTVDADGMTRVESRRGVAEIAGSGGSVLVRGGMRARVIPELVPEQAAAFNTFGSDEFDRWVETRESEYRVHVSRTLESTYEELPEEVRPYYVELSSEGDWVDTTDYGTVWTPSDVEPDWRPYQVGYWDYGPGGYFWVSNEPWGWAPYHYGRWAWVGGYGWSWVPGSVFAGAWVSWSWGPAYVGWSALDVWGYPIGYGSLAYGYYSPYSWVFVDYDDFCHYDDHHGHHGHGDYVGVEDVGESVRDHAIVTRPPRTSPHDLAESPETRAQVTRELAAERASRAGSETASRATARRFDNIERSLTASGDRARSTAASRTTPTTRGGVSTATTSRPTERPTTTSRSAATIESRSSSPSPAGAPRSYPRQISTGERQRSAPRMSPSSTTRPGRGTTPGTQMRGTSPSTTLPRVYPRQSDSSSRVRELYRSVAQPRQTRESPVPRASAPPRAGARPGAPQPSRGSSVSPAPRPSAAPRAGPPSRPSAPPRGSSARPSAPPKAPSARPSGPPRGSAARPSAAPSRSGGGAHRSPSSAPRSAPRSGGSSGRRG